MSPLMGQSRDLLEHMDLGQFLWPVTWDSCPARRAGPSPVTVTEGPRKLKGQRSADLKSSPCPQLQPRSELRAWHFLGPPSTARCGP